LARWCLSPWSCYFSIEITSWCLSLRKLLMGYPRNERRVAAKGKRPSHIKLSRLSLSHSKTWTSKELNQMRLKFKDFLGVSRCTRRSLNSHPHLIMIKQMMNPLISTEGSNRIKQMMMNKDNIWTLYMNLTKITMEKSTT
jgi:hypothetical protein